jgi:hypothetical protein
MIPTFRLGVPIINKLCISMMPEIPHVQILVRVMDPNDATAKEIQLRIQYLVMGHCLMRLGWTTKVNSCGRRTLVKPVS